MVRMLVVAVLLLVLLPAPSVASQVPGHVYFALVCLEWFPPHIQEIIVKNQTNVRAYLAGSAGPDIVSLTNEAAQQTGLMWLLARYVNDGRVVYPVGVDGHRIRTSNPHKMIAELLCDSRDAYAEYGLWSARDLSFALGWLTHHWLDIHVHGLIGEYDGYYYESEQTRQRHLQLERFEGAFVWWSLWGDCSPPTACTPPYIENEELPFALSQLMEFYPDDLHLRDVGPHGGPPPVPYGVVSEALKDVCPKKFLRPVRKETEPLSLVLGAWAVDLGWMWFAYHAQDKEGDPPIDDPLLGPLRDVVFDMLESKLGGGLPSHSDFELLMDPLRIEEVTDPDGSPKPRAEADPETGEITVHKMALYDRRLLKPFFDKWQKAAVQAETNVVSLMDYFAPHVARDLDLARPKRFRRDLQKRFIPLGLDGEEMPYPFPGEPVIEGVWWRIDELMPQDTWEYHPGLPPAGETVWEEPINVGEVVLGAGEYLLDTPAGTYTLELSLRYAGLSFTDSLGIERERGDPYGVKSEPVEFEWGLDSFTMIHVGRLPGDIFGTHFYLSYNAVANAIYHVTWPPVCTPDCHAVLSDPIPLPTDWTTVRFTWSSSGHRTYVNGTLYGYDSEPLYPCSGPYFPDIGCYIQLGRYGSGWIDYVHSSEPLMNWDGGPRYFDGSVLGDEVLLGDLRCFASSGWVEVRFKGASPPPDEP